MKPDFSECVILFIIVAIIAAVVVPQLLKDDPAQADMPTFEEIQEELVRRGHNIEIDGRIGKETLRAWDKEIIEQSASKMFKRMEKRK